MSWSVTIVPEEGHTSIVRYGHVRRILSDQWGFDFNDADCFGGAVVYPEHYELRVSIESEDQIRRVGRSLVHGKPYTEEDMRAIGSSLVDSDSVESIHLFVTNEGRKVLLTICQFCVRYNLRLLHGDTGEVVDISSVEDSDLYARALLEHELANE